MKSFLLALFLTLPVQSAEVFTYIVAGQSNAAGVGPVNPWQLLLSDKRVFLNVAKGGTFLSDWQEGTFNFAELAYWAKGCDAILWWQGEAESCFPAPPYFDSFKTFVSALFRATGLPIIPCKIEADPLRSPPFWCDVNAAIEDSWSLPHVFPGPDLSTLIADDVEGFHLISDTLIQQAANLWDKSLTQFEQSYGN